MTIQELIDELKEHDPAARIFLVGRGNNLNTPVIKEGKANYIYGYDESSYYELDKHGDRDVILIDEGW